MNCKKPYTVMSINEVDIDNLASVPDYFLGMREVTDPATGDTITSPVRVPGTRVMPTGNLANVVALTSNNTALNIPEGQVLAGYVDTQIGGNIVKLAGGDNHANFLMLGTYGDGKMLIQTTGFLNIVGGHRYIVGQQYYLGENGEAVTDSTVTGQKLFFPLDENILNVNGDF